VNQIRAMLNAYRVVIPGRLYGKRSLEALRRRELPSEDLQLVVGELLGVLEGIQGAIETLEGRIRRMGSQEPDLCALPQVAEQTAATLALELGDVSRFRRARAVASYAGLVPRVSQSADTRHHGRLTKRGNRELRWVLCQWAVRMLAKDPLVQAWAAPMLRRMSKNKVRVALARRLLLGVYVMRSRGEAFSLERCLGQ
jgi:transposase